VKDISFLIRDQNDQVECVSVPGIVWRDSEHKNDAEFKNTRPDNKFPDLYQICVFLFYYHV
jgi:hypothetical protein